MQTQLDGKTALVLGGSKGLGLGVAEALSARGAATLLVGRDEKALRDACERIESRGEGACATFAADLASEEGVETLLRYLETSAPGIDILLLNGGGPPPFAASSFDPVTWRQQFDSMFLNQIRIANRCLPGMRRRKWGRILAVASTSVREPIPGLTASNALRAAMAGWAKTLADEVAADGVTVNLLLPGSFETDRTKRLDAMDAAARGVDPAVIKAQSEAEIPIQRYGTPAEFGAVAAFLASDEAAYVTGIALPIDGGSSRGMI